MSRNTQLTQAVVSAQADVLARVLDSGFLQIYTGAQPATADASISSQVLLAALRFNTTSAPAAVNGVLTFNALTADSSADATGTAAWFRAFAADGTTPVLDGTVGATGSGSNLELSTASIVSSARISVSSFTHTVASSTAGL